MSTATVNPTAASTEQALTYENVTYARVYYTSLDKDGNDVVEVSVEPEKKADTILSDYEAAVAKAQKDGTPAPSPKVQIEKQTFRMPTGGTMEGFQKIVPDPKEQAFLAYRGLSTKLRGKAVSLLKETENDEYTLAISEDAFDLTDYAAEPTSRRSIPTIDKIGNLLPTLTPEDRAKLIAMLQLG